MNNHEELFIKNFIAVHKQERYLELLGKEKTRNKILNEFRVTWDLEKVFMTLIPINQQDAENIYKTLKGKRAPKSCHIISNDWEIDGKELDLKEALAKVVGFGCGTFVSCIAGKLGYFESDEAGERYILERK